MARGNGSTEPADPRTLDRADLAAATDVLTEAFSSDPLWVALYPDESSRRSAQASFFKGLVALAVGRGDAYGVGDPIAGVGIWQRSWDARPGMSWWALRQWADVAVSSFVFKAPRALPLFRSFDQMRRRNLPARHWRLAVLGVAQAQQGRGFGGLLIQALVDRADHDGLLAHTETVTPQRLDFYRRFGFEVVESRNVEGLNLTAFCMTRIARPRNSEGRNG